MRTRRSTSRVALGLTSLEVSQKAPQIKLVCRLCAIEGAKGLNK